jgi:hypothetical protein
VTILSFENVSNEEKVGRTNIYIYRERNVIEIGTMGKLLIHASKQFWLNE